MLGSESREESKGARSTMGTKGSWNCGRGSILGSESNEESKSITSGGGSISSAALSEDSTIGALGSCGPQCTYCSCGVVLTVAVVVDGDAAAWGVRAPPASP